MMKRIRIFLFIGFILCAALFLASCEQGPTPTPTLDFIPPPPTDTRPVPTPRPSITPIPTPTFTPTATPAPTNPPLATATVAPTQTPIPQAIIQVVSSENGLPVPGATVRLSLSDRGYSASFLTLGDGIAYFVGLVFSEEPYTLDVSAAGFRPISVEMNLTRGINQLTVQLEKGVVARIITETANLRVEPGLTFDVVVEVQQGQVFPIINVSDDGLWIQVRTPEGLEGWLFTNLVEIEGDISAIGEGTLTPAATVTSSIDGTPAPTPAPMRPDRIKFDAQALYNDMLALDVTLVQLRGVLDRRTSDIEIDCTDFINYYSQVIEIQTYRNVPEDWQRIHNLYVNAAGNTLETNRAIYLQCLEGDSQISAFNWQNARNGVDFSLGRLRAGILSAADLLSANQPTPES